MGKTYRQIEARLLGEYLAATYPTARIENTVRLGVNTVHFGGVLPSGLNKGAFSSYRQYVDAIVVFPDHVILVEGKKIANELAAAKLEKYAALWPATPGYEQYTKLPFSLLVVAAIVDPTARTIWEPRGVKFVQYAPSWLTADMLTSAVNTQAA